MNLKSLLITGSALFFTVNFVRSAPAAAENNCILCHSRLMKKYSTPVELYKQDIHDQAGITCSDCHGGDPTLTERHERNDPAQGFLGAPAPQEIPSFCDRCHGNTQYMRSHNPSLPVDQLVKYRTSMHGKLLFEKRDTRVANCVSCHGVHNIRPVKDPASPVYPVNLPQTCARCHSDKQYMADYGIPTDQHEKFASSVHGVALLEKGDVAAPACNDCHGNHGAIPPEVEHISQVCGLCHANNAKLYRGSFHASIFEDLETPECEYCHSNHAIAHPDESFLDTGENATCATCHEQEESDEGFAVSLRMKNVLDSLSYSISSTTRLVEQAEQQGMEASELRFSLRDIRQSLIEARTMVHSFDDDRVREVARTGIELAQQVSASAKGLLSEHRKRRWWLGGATLVLLALILGVYLKLREIEGR